MKGGATGLLAAAYLRMRFPNLRLAVVEGPHKNRPIVGESFVESRSISLWNLEWALALLKSTIPSMASPIVSSSTSTHPVDRTYIVDEAPAVPPLLSFQINRFTFDHEVRERNLKNGVQTIDGTVTGIDIGRTDELHPVTVHDSAQQKHTPRARWLIDATGRNRVLSRLLRLHEAVKEQKNVFWFRLVNFNPEILGRIHALKKKNRAFVPYFATHHFFWKG